MAETVLADQLADERAAAIRALLRSPLLDSTTAAEEYRVVVRHHVWLTEWFESTCGWALSVDPASGFARLAKRAADFDGTRPLCRRRGSEAPFDRRRYQLLCLVCAELVRHPVTTVGLLAGAITADAGLDTARHGERRAFVDALQTLAGWGALTATSGDLDAFVESDRANAILTADTARLHRLLASATAASRLADGLTTERAAAALRAEPRYGALAGGDASGTLEGDDDQRLRFTRHTLARRLLDDPVVYLAELSDPEREYVANPAGRRWLRDRVAEAGLALEERSDGLLAVDREAEATDLQFPAPLGNAHQFALLLADRLTDTGPDGSRQPVTLGATELRRFVAGVLGRYPGWARSHREGDGPERLLDAAVDLLVAFRLCRREAYGSVAGLPAIARYRVGEPSITGVPEPLFDVDAAAQPARS